MRRLEPQASLALPPLGKAADISGAISGWTVTEKGLPGTRKVKPHRRGSQSPLGKADGGKDAAGGIATVPAAPGSMTARGIPGELDMPLRSPEASHASGPKQSALKGRALENWLNSTLGQAAKPDAGAPANAGSKKKEGLATFGIDVAALEKLGLDNAAADRVYRAMFVYSQGLHAVLQEAVGKAKNSSQALLVLWRAFTAVLEHAGQSEQSGADSLAALVRKGNEEERERIEGQFKDQIALLQAQAQKLLQERRNLHEELQRLREDDTRLRNESEMYLNQQETAMTKYEAEIKQRIDAEVKLLDKTSWVESLQADLETEKKNGNELAVQLKAEIQLKETAMAELDLLRSQCKMLEAQAAAYKQSVMDMQQQRLRTEQQVGQTKQQLERMTAKVSELKEQLEHESERAKYLTEQNSNQQRELRKLERQCEDESHTRREIQNERDLQRDKLERLDTELSQLLEERRDLQKQFNDLIMEHRTNQVEMKRQSEMLQRTEQTLEKVQREHRQLLDEHRLLTVEAGALREDVQGTEENLKRESEMRKTLQTEKRHLVGAAQVMQAQLDSSKMAIENYKKELTEVTESKVKLESIVRDTRSAMQKANQEHQVEVKGHQQRVGMLEKVISDERAHRRNVVNEMTDLDEKREEAVQKIREKDVDIRELKRQRLEKEEEVERLKVLLKAQEQRNGEQKVIIDKYHGSIANHESETRQLQVLLEFERDEAKRQFLEMQEAYSAAEATLEQRIEYWKMSYEDALSTLNFNPATAKLGALERETRELKAELIEARNALVVAEERVAEMVKELDTRQARIDYLVVKLREAEQTGSIHLQNLEALQKEHELQKQLLIESEQRAEEMQRRMDAFDELKSELEAEIREVREANELMNDQLSVPKQDAWMQASTEMASMTVQTDLSYQYLDSHTEMHVEKWRRERLDTLKKASRYVEDPADPKREPSKTQVREPSVAQLGGSVSTVDIKFRGTASTGGTMSSRGPWPATPPRQPQGSAPQGPPPPGQAVAQALRDRRGTMQEPLHVAKLITTSQKRVLAGLQDRSGLTPSPWSNE